MSDRPTLTGSEAPRLEAPAAGGLHDRRTLDRILLALAVAGALLVAADPQVEKHPYFEVEHLLGFYAITGAAATALSVLVARLLRPLVRRPEARHDR